MIANAANITHSVDRALILDATASHDPDLATLYFKWTCLNPGLATSTCVDGRGGPLTITNSSKVTIPANSLRSNAPYVFTVHVTSEDGRLSTASSAVNIQK